MGAAAVTPTRPFQWRQSVVTAQAHRVTQAQALPVIHSSPLLSWHWQNQLLQLWAWAVEAPLPLRAARPRCPLLAVLEHRAPATLPVRRLGRPLGRTEGSCTTLSPPPHSKSGTSSK